jgi:hypothetical protein
MTHRFVAEREFRALVADGGTADSAAPAAYSLLALADRW